MRFMINLATRTYLDHRLINSIGFCVLAVLLIIAGWNVGRVSSNMGEKGRLSSEITLLQKKLGTKPSGVSEIEVGRQRASIRFFNEVIERKSMNWLNILDVFENNMPEGVSLSSLSRGKDLNEWKLAGRARSFKVVQRYLEMLESSQKFADVLLLSHQNLPSGEKVHGVQFTISCKVVTL
ncbi:MAG: PilN domain-containing protein [Desulfuromonadaceae bacterium]|nr:PilN domain-containing protein [Desulfuromonadaceae bacterium]MDD2846965.1 PilN domain-containing protein [Desulfuromonadaceae bacterium]MDD4129057.1 PilN domain-containing protein [Desulfuromonadaceae bacterium]